MRVKLKGRIDAVRYRLANFIGAENDEVVLVQNATTGINTILQNFMWKNDDILVGCKLHLHTFIVGSPLFSHHDIRSDQ